MAGQIVEGTRGTEGSYSLRGSWRNDLLVHAQDYSMAEYRVSLLATFLVSLHYYNASHVFLNTALEEIGWSGFLCPPSQNEGSKTGGMSAS